MTRLRRALLATGAVALVAASLGPLAPAMAAPGFVQRQGAAFTLDGKAWRPVGYNQYRLTSIAGGYLCDGGYGAISDASLATRLDQMKSAGANTVRTWFFQSYYQGSTANHWAPFDRLVNAAAARGMKVVPVLVNQWTDCEPSPAHKDVTFYESTYKTPNSFGYPLSFKSYASMVAQRYASNPAVAFWQLVNEAQASTASGACNEAAAASALRRFGDDMTAAIKAVDPNHLVSLGTIGSGQCGAVTTNFQYIHAGAIDMCDVHDYDHATQPIPGDQWNGTQVRLNQCNALGKPIVTAESGIVADADANGSSSGAITNDTLQRRARFFDAKLAAQFAAGMDGYLIWDKIVESSASSYNLNGGRFGVGPGDRTEAVMRGWGGQLGTVRSDWEDGTTGGWSVAWGSIGLANDATTSYSRLRSLRLTTPAGVGWPAARLTTGIATLVPGKTVTYRVFKPAAAPAGVGVKLFASDVNWTQQFSPDLGLGPGWNTVTFTVPPMATPLKAVGIQVNNGPGWAGSLYVDAVAWP